jgi:hemerythrin-like domain-containing protein
MAPHGMRLAAGTLVLFNHQEKTPMARAKKSSQQKPLALELLWNDHRTVEALFEQYDAEKEDEDDAREQTAERICSELTVHAQVEEELFYPWLRENLDEEDMELLEEAHVEHSTLKDLIAQIQSDDGTDAECDAKVKVLGEYVKHHVKEEENEIFEKIADKAEELDELGQEMYARKAELAEEMGLTQPEEDASSKAGRRDREEDSGQRESR